MATQEAPVDLDQMDPGSLLERVLSSTGMDQFQAFGALMRKDGWPTTRLRDEACGTSMTVQELLRHLRCHAQDGHRQHTKDNVAFSEVEAIGRGPGGGEW